MIHYEKKRCADALTAFCVTQQSYAQFLWISLCSHSISEEEILAGWSLRRAAQKTGSARKTRTKISVKQRAAHVVFAPPPAYSRHARWHSRRQPTPAIEAEKMREVILCIAYSTF
jgi:hypothetical protein